MKRFLICVALCLFVFGFTGMGHAANRASKFNSVEINRTESDDYTGIDTLRINDKAGTSVWRLDKPGNLSIIDSSGATDTYIPRDRVVYITTASQLSTWSGTTMAAKTGQSYYQCEPGKTYVVDPIAIATSGGVAPGGTTAMGAQWSGVSLILPDASKYSGPAYDVEVIIAATSGTSSSLVSGATTVYVWPYAGAAASGLTDYNVLQKAQTFATFSFNASNVPINDTAAAGTSFYSLNKLNESAVFGLQNSCVSAFVKRYLIKD